MASFWEKNVEAPFKKVVHGIENPGSALETMTEDIKDDPLGNIMGWNVISALPEAAGGDYTSDYWKAMGIGGAGALGWQALGAGGLGGGGAGGLGGGGAGSAAGGGMFGNTTMAQMLGLGLVGGLGSSYLQSEEQKSAYENNLKLQQEQMNAYTESLKAENRFTPAQQQAQQQWTNLINAQLSQGAGYTGPESALGQQMAEAQQANLGKLQGETLGQIGKGKSEAQASLGNMMRQRYGNATPGLQDQMMGQIESSYVGPTLQARMMPEQQMQQWKAGQAQQGYQNLMGFAQAPLGDLPQGYTEPLFQQADTSTSDLIGDMFSTYMMYNMMNQGKQQPQPTNINIGTSTEPANQWGFGLGPSQQYNPYEYR